MRIISRLILGAMLFLFYQFFLTIAWNLLDATRQDQQVTEPEFTSHNLKRARI
jgi:hypothetical protein